MYSADKRRNAAPGAKKFRLSDRVSGKNAGNPCLVLQKAGKVPFVLIKQGHQLRNVIDKIFADMGYVPDIILETDNWETCLHMVKSGIAFTILPHARIDIDDERIHKYCLKGDYYQKTFLCYRKNTYFSKAMTEFITVALSVFSQK